MMSLSEYSSIGMCQEKDQPDNLFQNVNGAFGSQGRFDKIAIVKDRFFKMTKYVPFNYVIVVMTFVILAIAVWLLV